MSKYLDEILEQKSAVLRLYSTWKNNASLKSIAEAYRMSKPPVIFVGMGSSHYAPIVVRSRLAAARIPFQLEEAGETLHYEMGKIDPNAWVIAISQSGESYETRVVAERLKGKVQRIIAITNQEGSSLAHVADDVLLLHAGDEEGSTTKTFINTLLALHLFTDAITGQELITDDVVSELMTTFEEQNELLREQTKEMIDALDITTSSSPDPLHIVARGPMMATALQSALILAETTDLFVSALSGATFRHGPFELAGPEHRIVFFAPSGQTQSLIVNMAKEVHRLGSKVVLISDSDEDFPFYHLRLPAVREELAPLLYFLPIEMLGYNVALQRGRTPGMMNNMGKVTTTE